LRRWFLWRWRTALPCASVTHSPKLSVRQPVHLGQLNLIYNPTSIMRHSFMHPFVFFIFIFLFGLQACGKKDTIIHGVVTDADTGISLAEAVIFYGVWSGSQFMGTYSIVTEEDGKYNIELKHQEYFSGLTVEKVGYVPKLGLGTSYVNGTVNDIETKLYPKNGILKLVLENTSSKDDSLYVRIFSPIMDAEYGISKGFIFYTPIHVQGISEHITLIRLASEETIDIYWGKDAIPASQILLAPNHDSVYVTRMDTTTLKISF